MENKEILEYIINIYKEEDTFKKGSSFIMTNGKYLNLKDDSHYTVDTIIAHHFFNEDADLGVNWWYGKFEETFKCIRIGDGYFIGSNAYISKDFKGQLTSEQWQTIEDFLYNHEGEKIEIDNETYTIDDIDSVLREIKRSFVKQTNEDLSQEQQEFFKNSKIRDKQGNLLVCYHGSPNAGFKEFDPKTNSKQFGEYKFGNAVVNFFTLSKDTARGYTEIGVEQDGNIYCCYLNIENPYTVNNRNIDNCRSWKNIQDDNVHDKQIEVFNKFWNNYGGNAWLDEDDIEDINNIINIFNLKIIPSSERKDKQCGYDQSEGYFDVIRMEENHMWGSERSVMPSYTLDELFDDDMYEEWRDNAIGDPEIDVDDEGKSIYWLTTNDIIRYVLYLNKYENANYDGIIVPDIYDTGPKGSIFDDKSTDIITLKSANQIKLIDNLTPTNSNKIDEETKETLHGSNWLFGDFNQSNLIWSTQDYDYARQYGTFVYECEIEYDRPINIGEINWWLDEGDDFEVYEYNGKSYWVSDWLRDLAETLAGEEDCDYIIDELLEIFIQNGGSTYADEDGILTMSEMLPIGITNTTQFKYLVRNLGYDCVLAEEGSVITYGVVSPTQVKIKGEKERKLSRDDIDYQVNQREKLDGLGFFDKERLEKVNENFLCEGGQEHSFEGDLHTDEEWDEYGANLICWQGDNWMDENDRVIAKNMRGMIEFGIQGKELIIGMIQTHINHRREGIATLMMDDLRKRYPNKKIVLTLETEDGKKFFDKYYNRNEELKENIDKKYIRNLFTEEALMKAMEELKITPTNEKMWIDSKGNCYLVDEDTHVSQLAYEYSWKLGGKFHFEDEDDTQETIDTYNELIRLVTQKWGWIRASTDFGGEIEIEKEPTKEQYYTLEDILDTWFNVGHREVKICIQPTYWSNKVEQQTYSLVENTGEEIVKKIKRFFTTGKLFETENSPTINLNEKGNKLSQSNSKSDYNSNFGGKIAKSQLKDISNTFDFVKDLSWYKTCPVKVYVTDRFISDFNEQRTKKGLLNNDKNVEKFWKQFNTAFSVVNDKGQFSGGFSDNLKQGGEYNKLMELRIGKIDTNQIRASYFVDGGDIILLNLVIKDCRTFPDNEITISKKEFDKLRNK